MAPRLPEGFLAVDPQVPYTYGCKRQWNRYCEEEPSILRIAKSRLAGGRIDLLHELSREKVLELSVRLRSQFKIRFILTETMVHGR